MQGENNHFTQMFWEATIALSAPSGCLCIDTVCLRKN